jgi:hypothetical protein
MDETILNEESEINQKPQRVFALVTDNEVFHKWYVEEDYDNPYIAALVYGLQSGPKVVDITNLNYEEIKRTLERNHKFAINSYFNRICHYWIQFVTIS